MSSEESGQEVIGSDLYQCLYVKSLTWREAKINRLMKQLDEKARKKMYIRA